MHFILILDFREAFVTRQKDIVIPIDAIDGIAQD